MRSQSHLIAFFLLCATACATAIRNIAYDSPFVDVDHFNGVALHRREHLTLSRRASNDSGAKFNHGVASGDPDSTSVLLWTRVTPSSSSISAVTVQYEVAKVGDLNNAANFSGIVSTGTVDTTAAVDWTVKIIVDSLAPGTVYYYRFKPSGSSTYSPTGRTKTFPASGVPTASARFAFFSCQSYGWGRFNAHRLASNRNLDFTVHLGDYIYEYGGIVAGIYRTVNPNREIISLADYRTRYQQYRADADLAGLHRVAPMIAVWDDHEFANNAYTDGAENHTPSSEGSWATRKAAAARAYYEWLPIRRLVTDTNLKIYRSFTYGALLDLVMLDTRIAGRNAEATSAAQVNNASRTLLGFEQEAWLDGQLKASTAKWRIIGNQVMIMPLLDGSGVGKNYDQWDGFIPARNRLLNTITSNNISNVVFITGDTHVAYAGDVTPTPRNSATYNAATGAGSVAVELVGPSVTSPSGGAGGTTGNNPHIRYIDASKRGYVVVEVTPQKVTGQYWLVSTVVSTSNSESLAKSLVVNDGQPYLRVAA
ncbi:putative alkaline phosphatase [Cladochytrium replicatum]|nr:putative alkaline phosphatase [Cladochytrium replicatum]